MKVSIASYDNTTDTHNSFSEITQALDFDLRHSFNTPAQCTITVSDPDGTIHDSYTDSSGSVYLGSGRVKVEHPTGTTVFDGRVIKARHDSEAGKTYLLCYDWLHQLSDERCTYDMREDLSGTGNRQSTFASDFDQNTRPTYTSGASKYAYDRNITYTDDEYKGYKMVIPSDAAGTSKAVLGPRDVTVTPPAQGDGTMDDTISSSELDEMWTNDTNYASASDNDDAYYVIKLNYLVNMPDGSLFDSFESARFKISHELSDAEEDANVFIFRADEGAYFKIGELKNDTDDVEENTFEVSERLWNAHDLCSSGVMKLRIHVNVHGGTSADLKLYYCVLEFEGNVSGHDSLISITDLGYDHEFTVDTDLYHTGLGYWEGTPYCIVDEISTHISTIASEGCQLVSLSTSVESNNRYSSRKFSEKTRLEILKQLSKADKAQFWVEPGTTTLNWKSTFDDATTNLTDSDVLAWTTAERDFEPIRNEYHLYGQRIGDNQLFLDTSELDTDPGANSKTLYETRSDVVKGTGATSYPELIDMGKGMVDRNDDVRFHLKASVPGYSHEVGSQLNVTSSILGLADQKYVVTDFQYDSENDRTEITLHPRVSVGYQDWKPMGTTVRDVNETAEDARVDTYVPEVL